MTLMMVLLGVAHANGQTSHLWISEQAVLALPEGELKDLLSREDLQPYLRNGTMFPDGGYPLGDDYAEIAHWEPFQSLYMEWIQDQWSAPFPLEAEQHIAFLFGLASHGMADQVYDAFYLEKAKGMDADSDWETYSNDEATDVAFSALTGPQEVPDDVVPYQTLVDLYAEYGYTVSTDTLEQGQSLLRIAVTAVGSMGQIEETVQKYQERFPWSTAHQLDDQRGNPPVEAAVIALYWQALWERLNGADYLDNPVIATFPADADAGLPTSAGEYDARPAVVFSRGLAEDDVAADQVTVLDGAGHAVGVTPDLYYRRSSHVLLFVPEQDWVEDEVYTLALGTGFPFLDGRTLAEPWSFQLRAGAPVPEDTGEPAVNAEKTQDGCGCASGSPGVSGALPLLALAGLAVGGRRRRG